jgi:FMN phosphatase YigB (HAD superfamily)
LRGIVFDFGNVLYSVNYSSMARELAGDRAADFLRAFEGSPCQVGYETGRLELEDVLEELGRKGFRLGRSRFLEAYLSIFAPVPGMAALLAKLAERRPLGLLSNTSCEHARLFIETVPEFELFDAHTYSFQVGCMKPDPRTYLEAAGKLGLAPEHLAYVDDIEAYAHGAAALGMGGLHFTDAGELKRSLFALGFHELEDA